MVIKPQSRSDKMAMSGTVTSYNPHKGWGFIECNGQDVFVNRRECGGICLAKDMQVTFTITAGDKGSQATGVTAIESPEDAYYHGEIKSFNIGKGYGFIGCEAFPEGDVFVLKSEMPGGFAPQGGHCKFKVTLEEKGPAAKDVQLLGAAGTQYQQMKQWGFGGKGYGKDMWGFGGKGFGGKGKGAPRIAPELKVWIGGLSTETKWKDLQAHVEQAGKTKWVEVFEGKGDGTGTAAFNSPEEVANAVSMLNGTILNGNTLEVDNWVRTPKES